MYTPRPLDLSTLDAAAAHYAAAFTRGNKKSRAGNLVDGPGYVMQDLYRLRYRDEHDWTTQRVAELLEPSDVPNFKRQAASTFEPRRDEVLEQELATWLAIRPDGTHIEGRRGRVQIGSRFVGKTVRSFERREKPRGLARLLGRKGQLIEVRQIPKRLYWPVFAGEVEERQRIERAERGYDEGGADRIDALPETAHAWSEIQEFLATNPRLSATAAIAMADALATIIDGGSTAATIRGRTGTQPADPDATESGTLLFTLTMSAPAFGGGATDGSPGGLLTADSIADDSSADATGTLGYCRLGSTGTGADDLVDGEAGTSGADFNFNTLAIVSGAVISLTSMTLTMPQS